jgi:hypothetical protein
LNKIREIICFGNETFNKENRDFENEPIGTLGKKEMLS